MLLTAPLAAFPARQALDSVLFAEHEQRWQDLRFYGLNVALYLTSYALAVLFPRTFAHSLRDSEGSHPRTFGHTHAYIHIRTHANQRSMLECSHSQAEITLVFNFTGAVGSATTAFVFPALFYLKCSGPAITRQTLLTRRVLPALLIAALGCASMLLGIVVHILELALGIDW